MYYQSYFSEPNDNIKKVWEGIKELVTIKTKNCTTPTSIEINNQVIIDPKLICNSFNNYFVNIVDDILYNRKYKGNKHFTEYFNNHMSNTFVFDLCGASEIYLFIQLSVDKASGPTGFPTKILQMISREINSPLSKICNIAVTTGTHPDS